MKKIICLLFLAAFLNGCAESVAILGPSIGAGGASGNVARSSINTAVNYSIKKQTGKSPIEHVLGYAEKTQKVKDKTVSDLKKRITKISKVKDLN